MEGPENQALKDKLLALATEAKAMGLVSRFYTETVLVICLPEENAGQAEKAQPPAKRGKGRKSGQGGSEGTLL